MTGRLVVLPSRSRILGRSVGYGAAAGAAAGAIVAATTGLVASVAALDVAGLAVVLIVAAPIAAAVGAVIGISCGLTGGLGLVICCRRAGASRGAIRAVAGCGAGLLPATWVVAAGTAAGLSSMVAPAGLTVVTVGIAAGLGPYAFYGRAPRSARRARRPGSGQPKA